MGRSRSDPPYQSLLIPKRGTLILYETRYMTEKQEKYLKMETVTLCARARNVETFDAVMLGNRWCLATMFSRKEWDGILIAQYMCQISVLSPVFKIW